MTIISGNQAQSAREATALALEQAEREDVAREVLDLFLGMVDSRALRPQAKATIEAALRARVGGRARWNGDWRLVPVPAINYDARRVPCIILGVQVYMVAVVRATPSQGGSSYTYTIVDTVGKPSTLVIPVLWLLKFREGEHHAFRLLRKEGAWSTVDVPGLPKGARLHDSFVEALSRALRGKSVYRWVCSFGSQGKQIAPVVAGWLLGLLLSGQKLALLGQPSWSMAEFELYLRSLGYKMEEIAQIKERKGPRLAGASSLEEALRIALEEDNEGQEDTERRKDHG